jgi:hypothetical protein
MVREFRCRCVYVEVSNEEHPRSGRFEYRAKTCSVCRARDALARLPNRPVIAFQAEAPRHDRKH